MPARRVHSAAMPELAEVEHGRRIAHEVAVGRTITAAWVDDDDIVVDGVTPDAVVAALAGATVAGTGRHGKHLWLVLQDRPTVLLHFGMTGGFRTRGDAPLQLEGSPSEVDTSWPPRFTKLLLRFDDGAELAMTNARRLGRIRLRDDVRAEAPIADLGFDPYLTLPTLPKLKRLLARRKRAKLKGLLLGLFFIAVGAAIDFGLLAACLNQGCSRETWLMTRSSITRIPRSWHAVMSAASCLGLP